MPQWKGIQSQKVVRVQSKKKSRMNNLTYMMTVDKKKKRTEPRGKVMLLLCMYHAQILH